MNRTKNSVRNIFFTIAGAMVTMLLQLINRRVFINYLSSEYLGLNGLFSNILSMLSLSEMGVGTAMIYALYKPVADNDTEKIKSLMQLYKKFYTVIGLFILLVGIAITPFLHIFIKEMPDISYIQVYYIMFVLDSGLSYFYTYKRSLIICNQQHYLSSLSMMLSNVVTRVAQLILLIVTHNYFLFLLTQIVVSRLENVVISKIADKKYPYLKDKNIVPLDRESKTDIKKNIFAMLSHKIGTVIVYGTDNLIISKILGLAVLGIYSNYVLLTTSINGLIGKVFDAITASVGNLVVQKDKEQTEKIFYNIFFANYWIYSFVTICFFCLMQPFVKMWVGENMLLADAVVWVIVIVFYLEGMRKTALIFRDATGVFWNDRYKAIIESVINLVCSIPLTFALGVLGVKLGTLISLLATSFWVEGYVLYKHFFKKSVKGYLLKQTGYFILTAFMCVGVNFLCELIDAGTILSFIGQCAICVVVPNVLLLVLFHRTEQFKYFYNILMGIVKKERKKQ